MSTPALALILENLALALRLHAVVPTLPIEDAYVHAAIATAAATDQVAPELLLAIAYVESRYDPTWVSRVEHGKRVIGRSRSTRPPRALDRRASMFCGPLQTRARSWTECLALRDPSRAYRAGAREIASWLRDRRVRGDVRLALAGYGCGNHGVTTGKCNRYPARVRWIERKLAASRPQA